MIDHSEYIKLTWTIIESAQSCSMPQKSKKNELQKSKKINDFKTRYGAFIHKLIYNSQLSETNLLIALYYQYLYYHHNKVLCFKHEDGEEKMILFILIMALVLANKSFDDQSYTLKTWLSIIENSTGSDDEINVDLPLLNSLETYFLSSLDFKLAFTKLDSDDGFWSKMTMAQEISLKKLVSSPVTPSTELFTTTTPIPNYYAAPVSATSSVLMSKQPTPSTCFTSPLSLKRKIATSPLTPLTPYDDHYKKRRIAHPHPYYYASYIERPQHLVQFSHPQIIPECVYNQPLYNPFWYPN